MRKYLVIILALILALSSINVAPAYADADGAKYDQNLLKGANPASVENWTDLAYDQIYLEIFDNTGTYENWDNIITSDASYALMPTYDSGYVFDGAIPDPFHQLAQQIDLSAYQAGEAVEAYVNLGQSLNANGIDHTAFLIVNFRG